MHTFWPSHETVVVISCGFLNNFPCDGDGNFNSPYPYKCWFRIVGLQCVYYSNSIMRYRTVSYPYHKSRVGVSLRHWDTRENDGICDVDISLKFNFTKLILTVFFENTIACPCATALYGVRFQPLQYSDIPQWGSGEYILLITHHAINISKYFIFPI